MTEIAGKLVLITGGAQGIGLEMAKRFAAGGAKLILTDVNESALSAAVAAIPGTAGYSMDVTNESQIAAVRKKILHKHGRVAILVNNAGVVFGGEFLATPMAKHRLTYEVNSIGLVAVAHAFLPDLIAEPESHVVTIASASGMIGLPYGATYASSKWSALGFAESIRLEMHELGHDHVKFTAVNPGYIKTGMFDGVAEPKMLPFLTPEGIAERIVAAVQANEVYVNEPFLVKLVPALRGLLPVHWRDKVLWDLGVTSSMKKWRGHIAAPRAAAGKRRRRSAG